MGFETMPTGEAKEKKSSSDVEIRVEEERLARREAERKSNERFNTDKKNKETDTESREVGKENISENLASFPESSSDVEIRVEKERLARRKAEKRGF